MTSNGVPDSPAGLAARLMMLVPSLVPVFSVLQFPLTIIHIHMDACIIVNGNRRTEKTG